MTALRAALLAFALVLAGCDSTSTLDEDYLSTYAFSAQDEAGVDLTSGTLELFEVPSDAGGIPSAWGGRWSLNASGTPSVMDGRVDGRGEITGERLYPEPVELVFTTGNSSDQIGYELSGEFSDDRERFVGTWTSFGGFTGGPLRSGPFEARLTKRARRYQTAG